MGKRQTTGGKGEPHLRDVDPARASEAGRMLGSISTPKKAAAAKENVKKRKTFGGPPRKDPLEVACTCGAGTDTVIGENHKTTCPRGMLLYQRARREKKAGQP